MSESAQMFTAAQSALALMGGAGVQCPYNGPEVWPISTYRLSGSAVLKRVPGVLQWLKTRVLAEPALSGALIGGCWTAAPVEDGSALVARPFSWRDVGLGFGKRFPRLPGGTIVFQVACSLSATLQKWRTFTLKPFTAACALVAGPTVALAPLRQWWRQAAVSLHPQFSSS